MNGRGEDQVTGLGSRPGLEDPRALEILTTEHWSLLSTRTVGYTEMFGRASIFIASLSGTVVALAFLAQASGFGTHSPTPPFADPPARPRRGRPGQLVSRAPRPEPITATAETSTRISGSARAATPRTVHDG